LGAANDVVDGRGSGRGGGHYWFDGAGLANAYSKGGNDSNGGNDSDGEEQERGSPTIANPRE
jgi:hypothetical protein